MNLLFLVRRQKNGHCECEPYGQPRALTFRSSVPTIRKPFDRTTAACDCKMILGSCSVLGSILDPAHS